MEARENFINTAKEIYEAEIFEAALSESADDVNNWVSEKTNGMIPQMLDEEPGNDVAMLLLNALYFNGVWDTPFEESLTEDRVFYREDGTTVEHPFMNKYEDRMQYIKTENAEGIKLLTIITGSPLLRFGRQTAKISMSLPLLLRRIR